MPNVTSKFLSQRENDAIRHELIEFKVQCLKVFCYHGNKSTILLFIQFLEQLLKFLANFTLLEYVKSQRSYDFLITKKLIFGFQILDLKVTSNLSHVKTRLLNMTWSNLRLKVWRSFVVMATDQPSCFVIQFLEQLLKFLVNFTLL